MSLVMRIHTRARGNRYTPLPLGGEKGTDKEGGGAAAVAAMDVRAAVVVLLASRCEETKNHGEL